MDDKTNIELIYGTIIIIIGILILIGLLFIAPSLGSHCLNETYCCNECVTGNGSFFFCHQYCTCPCDNKFDPFQDDPFYWFIERRLNG